MVGYAYSADYNSDYNFILIKSYDCDDLSLVNPSAVYHTYKVSRMDYSLHGDSIQNFMNGNLSHRFIKQIAEKLTDEECRYMYPIVVFWQITVSGICNIKSVSEMESVWPLSPEHLSLETPYVNISNMCFRRPFAKLEASFAVSVINEAMYLCGIYLSDLFVLSGNQVFCSSDFAQLVESVFCDNSLLNMFSSFSVPENKLCTVSASEVICNIRKVKFDTASDDYSYGSILTDIKRECVCNLMQYSEKCLEQKHSFKSFVRGARLIVGRSLREINSLAPEFMVRSNLTRSTDMRYLGFDDLLDSFTFADSMRDIRKVVKKERARNANIKRLSRPLFIYKGKIINERCSDEN